MNKSLAYFLLWIAATTIAIFLALLLTSASLVDGEYIPVGNDSFYHARRILDAAIGERGFYQFDDMIHAPEGSWLNWPWGYDYFMAVGLSTALWFKPSLEPMAFLAYVPVAWLFINVGLATLIGRQIGLSPALLSVALLGFVMLPLTQVLHGVGTIDHHFIELTFALAAVWAALRFFGNPVRIETAVTLGVILGIAPAFHNGLFILQVPLLACLFVCWLRGQIPERRHLFTLAGALSIATLICLLPSATFRAFQFEFWTLSWFHLYIAASTTAGTIFMAVRPFQKANFVLLLGLGALLVVPISAKILTGTAFLSGDLDIVAQVVEVKSPFAWLMETRGLIWVTSFYSWLIFIAPFLIILFAKRLWQSHDTQMVCLSVFVLFGLLLMLMQYRLHPFGSWAIFLGGALVVQDFSAKKGVSMLVTTAVALFIVAIAFQPPLKNRLFKKYEPATESGYASTRSLFRSLGDICAEDSGTVLSYSDDGHYIRYHTDCSVLHNNFLMTPLHEKKLAEADKYLRMDPEQLLVGAPEIEYVFVRMYEVFEPDETGLLHPTSIPDLVARNAPLFVALTFADELPKEYQLIDELRTKDERDFAYARVFKIERDND